MKPTTTLFFKKNDSRFIKNYLCKISFGCVLLLYVCLPIDLFGTDNEKKNDTNQIQINLELARNMLPESYDSSLNIALRTLYKAQAANYKKGISDANEVLGYIYAQSEKWHTPKESELLAMQITSQLNNNRPLSKVLIDIAEDYYRFTLKAHAAEAMDNSANIAGIERNFENQIYALTRKAEILGEIGDKENCNETYSSIFTLLNKQNDSVLLIKSYISCGKTEMLLGNYSMSIDNFNKAITLIRTNDTINLVICYLGFAQNYLYLQQHLKAIEYIERCEQIPMCNSNLNLRSQLYLVQSQYYEKFDQYLALSKYKDYIMCRDSIYLINEKSYINVMRSYFNSQKKEEEIDQIRQQVDLERIKRRTFLILSLILGAFGTISVFAVRKRNKILARENDIAHERIRIDQERQQNIAERTSINRQKEENKKQLELIEKQKLQQELERAELERQRLELELDEKHRSLLTNSIQNEQYNEFLNEMINQIAQLKSCNDKRQWSNLLDQLSTTIKSKQNQTDDWENIKLYFEMIHPNFFEKLKNNFPDLSINELKLCAYTKMNLNGKEISRLLNINPSSVQISRYRLKKKLGLPEEVNFTDYILQNY